MIESFLFMTWVFVGV